MTEFDLEKKKLQETTELIKKILETKKQELENLYNNFIGEREELWRRASEQEIHIKNIETAVDKPYFARIDFQFDGREKIDTIYIGRHGISDGSEIVVTDWRAPISSLYYDSEVGPCSFEAPKEKITGNMSLKRQFEIEDGQLLRYFDVDLVTNDALLQKYLNSNNDTRLKSIVSTIQREQNDVIRKKMYDNLIVQGVAGSGKTTVALHRIAYLVYNYMKSIHQNQYLVIGPNPVFIKYVENVLPDLDVAGVTQCTFEEFAQKYINENLEIISSEKKATNNIAKKLPNDVAKFKSSLRYKAMVDQFLSVFIKSITINDLKLDDFTIVSHDIIETIFNKIDKQYSLNIIIEQTINLLIKYIENNMDYILSEYNDYSFELFKNVLDENEKNKLRNKFAKDREEIKKGCKNTIRKYFNKTKIEVTKLYKLFISTIENYDLFNYNNLKALKKETLANIKTQKYEFEDLAALLYIKYKIAPNQFYKEIRHTVIDEAQDLGEFNFFVLKKCLPSSTFSIFGDLAQSIYDYRGIDNWNVVNTVMFNNDADIIYFDKSYRTTAEIMETADDIAESIGLSRSNLVVRHGADVNITHIEDTNSIPSFILNKIQEYKEKGYKTIAVISKTNLLSQYINDDLAELGLIVPNVKLSDDLTDEKFNVCTISNQLAKGLEFDAVIINNASEDIYSSDSNLDMKLLYVAVTRALHELDIVFTRKLSKPLEKTLERRKNLTK